MICKDLSNLLKMDNDTRISNWINNNLKELSQLHDNSGVEILNKCGGACCETSKLYQDVCKVRNKNISETNIDKLFNEFKNEYYNSSNFTKVGNTITLIFEECTCPMVKNGVNNSFLCNCTIGYSEKLFVTLFNKKVTIDLEKSILKGDGVCKQIIKVLT